MNTPNGTALAAVGSREISMIGEPYSANHDRIDLGDSLSFFRRHGLLILATMAAVMVIALVGSLLMPKTYHAHASVMLMNEPGAAGQTASSVPAQAAISNQMVDTQVEVIHSSDMAERVVDALQLAKALPPAEREDLVNHLKDHVGVERSGQSYAMNITYAASTPEEAARIANGYAEQYTKWQMSNDQQRTSEALGQVEAQLVKLRAQAQSDTQSLQQYRIANNLLSTSGASLTEQEISNYDQEVARAKAQAAEDEARLQTARAQLRSGSTGDDVGEALGSQVISALRAQEAQIAGDVANMSSRYGPQHPELIRKVSQVAEVRAQIQSEIGRVVSNLQAKADVSSQRLASLNSSLSNARGKLSQNNAAMVGLSGLERSAAASQAIYETYLNSYKQLLASKGTERPTARVLTMAGLPKKADSPNLKLNLLLALVIGLGFGVIAAYIVDALFQGLTSPEEVERHTGLPFLGSIPLLSSVSSEQTQAISAVRDEPFSVFTEAFRGLGTAVEMSSPESAQVIAVTSALPGEGKTVISCCLSHVYATGGKRTILIDCDLRRRGISKLLNVQSRKNGLIEVLKGKAKFNYDKLNEDYVFWVLPLLAGDEGDEDLLTGPAFTDLLAELRTKFDRIVLDLPPTLPIAYASTLASRADSVIMAAKWRETSSFALRAALRRLPRDQINVSGVALSQVDIRRRAYFGKLDPAFYYKMYREYYA